MLRPSPTMVSLTMADVDLACRRLTSKQEALGSTAPLPRFRRGAQRSWEDAFTQRRVRSYESSAVFEENVQEAEFSPPRYRKDLSKLGVPYSSDATVPMQRRSDNIALDGIDETIANGPTPPLGGRRTWLGQTSYAASPLRHAYALSSSSDDPNDDRQPFKPAQATIRAVDSAGGQTDPRESCDIAAMRIMSSQERFIPAADTTNQPYMSHMSNQPRPPIARLSSVSSPNLTSRTVSSGIIHSRNVSASMPLSTGASDPATALFGYMTPRAVSRADAQPALEIIRHCTSPLGELQERLEALSEQASPRSSCSFYTANSQSRKPSDIRFPSFESPPKRSLPTSTASSDQYLPTSSPPAAVSIEPLEHRDTKIVLSSDTGSPSVPFQVRPIAVPLLPPTAARTHTSALAEPSTSAMGASSAVQWRPRQDSGVSISIMPKPLRTSDADDDQAASSSRDGQDAHVPIYSPHRDKTLGLHRGFPVFSPDLDGAGDYSRYPDPRLVLNRRSMPSAPSSSYLTTELDRPSHRPERPYSHGARPRGDSHHAPHSVPQPAARSGPSHSAFNDRLPPRPTGIEQGPIRSPPPRNSNRENDGSAEEEMLAREFGQMQLRGGAGGQRRSNENAPASGAAAVVLDDTPPRQGRLERLMRN